MENRSTKKIFINPVTFTVAFLCYRLLNASGQLD